VANKKKATASGPTASGPRDYVEAAVAYANEVLADKKRRVHSRLIQLAAKRFLSDLKRAKRRGAPFYFDAWHANDACDFIEKLPHVEGVWKNADGTDQPCIVLHRSHVFFVVQLFGFRTPDGTRRFTSALFAVARKNAKSTLSAAILLYCQCCEEEPGAQIISAATTGQQARLIFNVAKAMVTKTPDLREAFGLAPWANAISRIETGASFKPINSKASTQDGLNPSHVGIDEIHAHKTADLLNVIQSAAGARRCPLFLFTTTEGYTNAGPWSDLRKFAKDLLKGLFGDKADHFLAVIFAVDEEDKAAGVKADDDFNENAWKKANPLHDANPHLLRTIRKEAIEAKHMPSKMAEFRIKRLNRPSATAAGWIDLGRWQRCNAPVVLDDLIGHPCWGGLDLASTQDLTVFRLVWLVDGVFYTHAWRWVPANAVAQRTERGTVPYAAWVEAGLIQQTAGDVTDYAVVEATILAACERFNPQKIGYDAWNATDLVNRLVEQSLPMVQFIQGPKSYHPAMQALERAYIGRRFEHGGDEVLNWCASNVVARRDRNLNMAPDKQRSADKIDDITALLMAFGVSLTADGDGLFEDFLAEPIVLG
jgi:phage terminase large subunit-like protein